MNDIQTTFRAGHVIQAQYRVIELLGQGASGAVYLVADESTNQSVFALKEVKHDAREERGGLPFDATALKRLDHPALPRVHRVFHGGDRLSILMDYVEGSSLEAMRQLMPGKRFSLHAAITLLSPVMDAVSYLHQQHPPLVHGDIKPSNIIVPNAGTSTPSKLVDFGGVANVSAGQRTLNFRAPEQFGKRASRRSDVYALGAIFYTLLTGEVPAAASVRLARIGAGEPDPLVPVERLMPSLQSVASAIDCALSISRHDRFASVEQFRGALWQVVHASQMATRVPELTGLDAAVGQKRPLVPELMSTSLMEGKKAGQDPSPLAIPEPRDVVSVEEGPHGSKPEVKVPASLANAIIHARGATSTLLPPAGAREGIPPLGPPPAVRRKKRRLPAGGSARGKYTRPFLAGLVLLLLCVSCSGVALYTMLSQKEEALAQVGIQHLQTALSRMQTWSKKPFAAPSVTPARQEFAAASAAFTQLDADLRSFAGVGTLIPGTGDRLSAALHVVPIVIRLSQAGVSGCDALNGIISRLHEPLGAGIGLSLADITEIGKGLRQVEADINQVAGQVKALAPADVQFDPRVGKALAALHQYLPTLQALLRETDQLLPVLPSLLGIGTPAYYLVEILDSTQLRPGVGSLRTTGSLR